MRFGIAGAGNIAHKFARAAFIAGHTVTAVAARELKRAQQFAQAENIPTAYGSYADMLAKAPIDCLYIATVPSTHYELTMAALDAGMPVLCEKAMFNTEADAIGAFDKAHQKHVFCMEAMWSKFLPANIKAREWLSTGRIGAPVIADIAIGFDATPSGDDSRYLSRKLCGGATTDITVYTYEILTWMLGGAAQNIKITALPYHTGVDATEIITCTINECVCSMRTTLLSAIEENLIIYGSAGSIVIPHPHFGSEASLYDKSGALVERYTDPAENGFVYEIAEAARCIEQGLVESPVHRHADTIECARLFDAIRSECGANG